MAVVLLEVEELVVEVLSLGRSGFMGSASDAPGPVMKYNEIMNALHGDPFLANLLQAKHLQ